jgi:hypothetical protein
MRHLFPLLAVAVVTVVGSIGLSSCSSSRNAQTTDDVYYSSGSRRTAAAASNEGEYYSTAPSDNYVRMKAENPARWSYFDDYNAYDSYYYAPMTASMGYGYPAYGFGYGYPAYGFGYGLGYTYGLGFGYGLGFWDPYLCWNSYFLWNSWYNPYFYNPYYGGGVLVVGKSTPTAIYSNLRPFNSVAYRNGLAHNTATMTTGGARFYRPGMSTTSSYNSGLSGQGRQVNNSWYRPGSTGSNNGGYRPANTSSGGFRPVNTNNNGGYRPAFSQPQPTRTYSPSFGGGGGGGGFSRPGHH